MPTYNDMFTQLSDDLILLLLQYLPLKDQLRLSRSCIRLYKIIKSEDLLPALGLFKHYDGIFKKVVVLESIILANNCSPDKPLDTNLVKSITTASRSGYASIVTGVVPIIVKNGSPYFSFFCFFLAVCLIIFAKKLSQGSYPETEQYKAMMRELDVYLPIYDKTNFNQYYLSKWSDCYWITSKKGACNSLGKAKEHLENSLNIINIYASDVLKNKYKSNLVNFWKKELTEEYSIPPLKDQDDNPESHVQELFSLYLANKC